MGITSLFTRISFVALAVGLGMAAPARAQTADASPSPAPPRATVDSGEIVVTANKREQRLNDVGASVAVVGGAELGNRQINNLQDLAATIPSLSYSNSANGTPIYTLRGVGFNESSLGAYPTVSVYLDEAPLPFGVLTRHSAFDLERGSRC